VTGEDRDRAMQSAVEALRRPLTRQQQRQADQATAVALAVLRQQDRRRRRLPR
jgi:hypothetical protein